MAYGQKHWKEAQPYHAVQELWENRNHGAKHFPRTPTSDPESKQNLNYPHSIVSHLTTGIKSLPDFVGMDENGVVNELKSDNFIPFGELMSPEVQQIVEGHGLETVGTEEIVSQDIRRRRLSHVRTHNGQAENNTVAGTGTENDGRTINPYRPKVETKFVVSDFVGIPRDENNKSIVAYTDRDFAVRLSGTMDFYIENDIYGIIFIMGHRYFHVGRIPRGYALPFGNLPPLENDIHFRFPSTHWRVDALQPGYAPSVNPYTGVLSGGITLSVRDVFSFDLTSFSNDTEIDTLQIPPQFARVIRDTLTGSRLEIEVRTMGHGQILSHEQYRPIAEEPEKYIWGETPSGIRINYNDAGDQSTAATIATMHRLASVLENILLDNELTNVDERWSAFKPVSIFGAFPTDVSWRWEQLRNIFV